MNVNKKKLAEIFGCDVRTVTAWQSQGLPLVSGGGKGIPRHMPELLRFTMIQSRAP